MEQQAETIEKKIILIIVIIIIIIIITENKNSRASEPIESRPIQRADSIDLIHYPIRSVLLQVSEASPRREPGARSMASGDQWNLVEKLGPLCAYAKALAVGWCGGIGGILKWMNGIDRFSKMDEAVLLLWMLIGISLPLVMP